MQDDYTQSGPGAGSQEREGLPSSDELRDAAGSVAGAVKDEYGKLRDEAAHETREMAHAAQRQARAYADEQRVAAADSVQAIANALYSSGDTLEAQGRDSIAALWRRGAAGTEDLAKWLEGRSVGDLWQQAQTYARRQPGVSFGGALAAGFLLARFLKSSAPQEPQMQGGSHEFARESHDPEPTPNTSSTPSGGPMPTTGTPRGGISDY